VDTSGNEYGMLETFVDTFDQVMPEIFNFTSPDNGGRVLRVEFLFDGGNDYI